MESVMTMPYTATEKQVELKRPVVSTATARGKLRRRVARNERLFEGKEHVRKLTRSGQVEYQYRREINPKPLRPVAQRLFGRWSVVRALHTEADYHTAALEYDGMVRRCREMIDAEGNITMVYRGPLIDPYLTQAIIGAGMLGLGKVIGRDAIPTLRLEGLTSPRVTGTTPYSTEEAIKSWVTHRPQTTKPNAERNKRTKMLHFYAWVRRSDRSSVPMIDAPPGFKRKSPALLNGKIADLSRDDLTLITTADLQAYKEYLLAAHGNNHVIDHLCDIKVLLTRAFDDGKFGPDGKDPGATVKLPAKREKGKRQQFTDDEVRIILAALPGTAPHIEWPTLIMAHLGLICEEIADATTHDVERIGDMVVLHVRSDHRVMVNGQKNDLKTEFRPRSLPLPPDLAERFWDRVLGVRASYGDGPLFPEVAPDRDGIRSDKLGRKIRDLIDHLGIAATPYSFRHRFLSQLKTICPDPDYRRYIAGHKPKDVHADTYLHYEPWELKPFLDQIQPAGRPG
jgi:hypothetical protein